jgi:acyl carrier protein
MNDMTPQAMDTLSKIQSMLSTEYDIPLEKLAPGQALAELGIDSLTTIEFMFKLEDEFSISLAEERGTVTTVQDIALLVDGVRQKQSAKA